MAYIYGLIDPITNQLRYVGYTTKNVSSRQYEHWRSRKGNKSYKNDWINSLWNNFGVKPEVITIEEISDSEDDWAESECFWIDYFRYIGCKLTNFAVGGKGRRRGSTLSNEHRGKISSGVKKAYETGVIDRTTKSMSRRGKPTWNSGKRYTLPAEVGERRKSNPNRLRPKNTFVTRNPRIKCFNIVSPTGEIIHASGAYSFAKEHKLPYSSFFQLLNMERDEFKGWTRPPDFYYRLAHPT